MGMGGNLLHKLWLWLNCWLRASLYWFSKIAISATIRFRRRLLKVKEKKAMLRMGRRIQELHQSGQNAWSEDNKVKEILQILENNTRKKEELLSRLQEKKDRYREKVKKLRDKATSQPKGSKGEAGGDSVKSNSKF